MKNSDFYNNLASDYDEMINFDKSLANKVKALKHFIKPEFKTALDLGCGSGADSIALTKNGLKVDAVDHSQKMINKAKLNTKVHNVDADFIYSNLNNLHLNKEYDLIVSLGNTIANISSIELDTLIKKLKNNLSNDGLIIFQTINYATLPNSGLHILNEFENQSLLIRRLYKIRNGYIDFIIEKKDKLTNKKSEIITKLYPHSSSDFRRIAIENNMSINFWGNLDRKIYLEKRLKNNLCKWNFY